MRLRLLPILLLTLVAGCAETENDTGTPADEAAIRAENDRYAGLWNAKDTTAIFATISDDYVEVNADGLQINDKAAALAQIRKDFSERPDGLSLSLTTEFVKFLDDDVAVTGGTWTLAGGPPGMPTNGAWNATMRKEGETWKSVNTLVAAAVVPPPAAPDTTAAAPAQ